MKRKENKLNEIRQSNQQKQQIIEKNEQQFEQRNNVWIWFSKIYL